MVPNVEIDTDPAEGGMEREHSHRDGGHRDIDHVVPDEDRHQQAVGVSLQVPYERGVGEPLGDHRLDAVVRQ